MQSWYTGRWWVGCYVWYSEEGPGWAVAPPSPLLAVPDITADFTTLGKMTDAKKVMNPLSSNNNNIIGQYTNHCIAIWCSIALWF